MPGFSKLIGALILASIVSPAAANECGNSDVDDWRELSSLYWAGQQSDAGRPVMYTIAAPWCPYCAQLFKLLQNRKYSFDVRFIEVWPTNETHKDQIADIVMDGTEKGLARNYIQKSPDKTSFSAAQRNFIDEVQEVTAISLQSEYGKRFKQWASPDSIVMLGNETGAITGMPKLDTLETQFSRRMSASPASTSTRRFLKAGLPAALPIAGDPVAKRANTKLRVLPDITALTAMCLQAGTRSSIPPTGYVKIDGRNWLVYNVYRPNTRLRAYALGDDFADWSPRR